MAARLLCFLCGLVLAASECLDERCPLDALSFLQYQKSKQQQHHSARDVPQLLEQLATQATQMVASGKAIDNTTKVALDLIKTEMTKVKKSINVTHAEDQDEVAGAKTNIEQCNTVLSKDMSRTGGINSYRSLVENKSSTMESCRRQEVDHLDDRDSKNSSLREAILGERLPSCASSFMPPDLSVDEPETLVTCSDEIAKWANPVNVSLHQALNDFKTAEKSHSDKRAECNHAQAGLESTFCTYAALLRSACSVHEECMSTEKEKQKQVHSKVQVAEASRKTEYKATDHVICFADLLLGDNATAEHLDFCKKKNISVSFLEIHYPATPAAAECDLTPVTSEPGDSTWAFERYGSKEWFAKASSTSSIPCTAPDPVPAAPPILTITEPCGAGHSTLTLFLQGQTASGAPYYKTRQNDRYQYLYHDPDCNGNGTVPRWILDGGSVPSTERSYDLDGDSKCSYYGRLDMDEMLPLGSNTWKTWCNDAWTWGELKLEVAQPYNGEWFFPGSKGVTCHAPSWDDGRWGCNSALTQSSGTQAQAWHSQRNNGVNGDNQVEMTFDFQKTYTISGWKEQCAKYWGNPCCLKKFKIQKRRSNNDPWADVFEGEAAIAASEYTEYADGSTFTWEPTAARYWKLVMLSNHGDTIHGGRVALQNIEFQGAEGEYAAPAAAAAAVDMTCEDWSVEYNGKCYAVLPKTLPSTGTPSSQGAACYSDFLPLPAGYQLVDYSNDVQTNVASQHQFGTWRVVYSNGMAYGTGTNGDCGRCNCTYCDTDGLLTEGNGQYKVSSCSAWAQVFIVKDMTQTAPTTRSLPGAVGHFVFTDGAVRDLVQDTAGSLVQAGTSQADTSRPGQTTGYVYHGTGAVGYASIPENSAYMSRAQYTIALWVNPASIAAGALFSCGESFDTDKIMWGVFLKGNGSVMHWSEDEEDSDFRTYSTQTLQANSWKHLIVVRDEQQITFYINGVAAGSAGGQGIGADIPGHILTIGCRTNSGNVYQDYFNGKIDDVWLSNSAITSAQALSFYQSYVTAFASDGSTPSKTQSFTRNSFLCSSQHDLSYQRIKGLSNDMFDTCDRWGYSGGHEELCRDNNNDIFLQRAGETELQNIEFFFCKKTLITKITLHAPHDGHNLQKGTLQYMDGSGAWVTAATGTLTTGNPVDLTANYAENKYFHRWRIHDWRCAGNQWLAGIDVQGKEEALETTTTK